VNLESKERQSTPPQMGLEGYPQTSQQQSSLHALPGFIPKDIAGTHRHADNRPRLPARQPGGRKWNIHCDRIPDADLSYNLLSALISLLAIPIIFTLPKRENLG